MNDALADFLLAAPGRALLAESGALWTDRIETLAALMRLRKTATPEQAAAAWEMTELRRRGAAKFGPDAARMYFVREALEQASGAAVAAYHASRMAASGLTDIADLGGGIGGDALAFARAGLQTTLYERDLIRAQFAAENVRALGLTEQIRVVQADVMASAISTDAVWLDPARRRDSRRVSDPEDYSPPLPWLHSLTAKAIGVKLSPAIDHSLAGQFGAELEFLSEGGECREALLWLGAAQTGAALQATVLTEAGKYVLSGSADQPDSGSIRLSGSYLHEPDPAVIRAHLVGTLAEQIDAALIDLHIAYLLSDTLIQTPFAKSYCVLEQFPYSPKRLQKALTAQDVGRVVIKKRGFPQEPDAVRKQLKLRGSREIIVVLARVGSGHQTFLCVPALPSG